MKIPGLRAPLGAHRFDLRIESTTLDLWPLLFRQKWVKDEAGLEAVQGLGLSVADVPATVGFVSS